MINSKFWSDSFVVDKLNPLDRYLFLYLLTNEKTNLCGVYEIPLRTIANETGIEKEEIIRMLERLKEKVEYKDGWVCLVNFLKHQNQENKSIVKGIENRMKELPESVLNWAISLRGMVSGRREDDERGTSGIREGTNLTKLNLTKPNLNNTTETLSTKISGSPSKKKNTETKQPELWEKEDKLKWRDDTLSKGKYGEVIIDYFIIKEMKFPTKFSANQAFKREIKIAKEIVEAYPDMQLIKKALFYSKKNMKPEMWTLETINKKILPTL